MADLAREEGGGIHHQFNKTLRYVSSVRFLPRRFQDLNTTTYTVGADEAVLYPPASPYRPAVIFFPKGMGETLFRRISSRERGIEQKMIYIRIGW